MSVRSLSICIPTYNHCDILERMLTNLVSLPTFASGDVEVVISDNCSTDQTQKVGEKFALAYPDRVRYFRNEENLKDKNFALALSRGTGSFLKLANDTLLFRDEGVAEMLATVKRHENEKPVLFFLNREGPKGERRCSSFDEFLDAISFHSTWIASFGMWRDDFDRMDDFNRMSALKLTQVDVLCRMMSSKKCAVVNRQMFFELIPRVVNADYNLAEVFGRNYFSILREYVEKGELSKHAFRREKFRMLWYHIVRYYLLFSPKVHYPKSGYIRYLFKDYWASPFYWCTVPFVFAAYLVDSLFRRNHG